MSQRAFSAKKSRGPGYCQVAAVVQKLACNRKATTARRTSGDKVLRLCAKCDEKFGRIIGEPCDLPQ